MQKSKLKIKIQNFLIRAWPVLVILLIVVVFARPWWQRGLIPFPGDYLVNAFVPWQYYYGIPVKNNAMPDVVTQMHPWKKLVIEMWKGGQVPLWNPNNFSGSPLLANYQSAVFHPFNWLFLLLPQTTAWGLMIFFQPLLAGWFSYLLAREFKISKPGALISALAFMFCGFITTWMAYGTMAFALLFLPLILWLEEKSFQGRPTFCLPLISLALAASFCSGHFQISLYVLLAGITFLVFKLGTTKLFKRFFLVLVFVLLGIGLAAIQLLPTFELHQLSVRSQALGIGEVIPWQYLVTLIAPDFYGNQVTRNNWFGHYAEWLGFFGVIPLMLAFFSFFSGKNENKTFLIFLGLGALALALPTPLLVILEKTRLPVLSTSAVSRIVGVFSFCFALLAGFGWDEVVKALGREKLRSLVWRLLPVLTVIALLWLILVLGQPFEVEKVFIAKRNLILPSLLAGGFFLAMMLRRLLSSRVQPLFTCGVIFLIAFEMLRFATKWYPFAPKEYVYPRLPVLDFLAKTVSPDRLFGYFGMEVQNYFQIPGFQGYDPLYLQRYGELLMAADDGKTKLPSTRGVGLGRREKFTEVLLNLLGGKYILHALPDDHYAWVFPFWEKPTRYKQIYQDDKYEVYENLAVFPRTFLVTDYQIKKEGQEIITAMFDSKVDLRETVILEERPSLELKKGGQAGEAKIADYQANKVVITTESRDNNLLFLSDNYYPGWRVYVDDQEAKIYRADYTFRAVAVPAGKHQVAFVYQPVSFLWGKRITLLSLAILGLTGLWGLRKK